MPTPAPHRSPLIRKLLCAAGVLVMLASPLVGVLPGPGGTFVFAFGLVLVLQNSAKARRWFARTLRKRPRLRALTDRALRRRSSQRRRERLRRMAGRAA